MNAQGKLFLLGDLNVDVILSVEEYPPPGGDVRSEKMVIEAGGSAANSAVVLARLGRSPSLIARVGHDDWAELAERAVRAAGVSTGDVQRSEQEQTGLMFIPVTPDGQRTLFGRRAANRSLQAGGLPERELRGAEALHISGYAFLEAPQREAALRAIDLVSEGNGLVSLDTAYQPPFAAAEPLRRALPRVALLILGEDEAEALSGRRGRDSVDWMLDQGVDTVALKMGPRGAEIHRHGSSWKLPALPAKTVDTTGAGDAFSAGVLHGQLGDLSPPASGLIGSACGAAATTVWGAGAAFPSSSSVVEILRRSEDTLPKELQPELRDALSLLENTPE